MLKRTIFMAGALAIFSGHAWALNRAIVFGGNCDGPTATNTFLYNMASESAALSKNGWQVENLYSGASARCTLLHSDPLCSGGAPSADCCPEGVDPQGWNISIYSKISGVPADQIQVASKANLIKALNDAQDLGPSDQLLILFETHGSEPDPRMRTGHGVCADQFVIVGDQKYDPIAGEDSFYVALDQLKAKGVKMAIVDDSCYSGGSVSNFGEYGCVLSAGSSNRPTTELPGSTALIELLNGQDFRQDGGTRPIASLGSLELEHLDSGAEPAHRLTMEELYLKSLFTGNSLLLSERMRELNGFSPGNAFVEKIAAAMIPTNPNGDEDDLYPDFEVNTSSSWSDSAAMSGVARQIAQLLDLLQGSVIPPDPKSDLSSERKIVAAYTRDLKDEGYDFSTPAFDLNPPQAGFAADIRMQLGAYEAFADKYAFDSRQIQSLKARILNSSFPIRFEFSGPLAGAEDAFWKAYTSSSGSLAHLTDPGTGRIANITLWSNMMPLVDLSPENMAAQLASQAALIASTMQSQGFAGVSPEFVSALAQMMATSIRDTWNSIPPDQQAALRSLNEQYTSAVIEQSNAYNHFEDHDNFRTGINLRIGQNQAYNFLNYRGFLLGSGSSLAPRQKEDLEQLKQCSDFTLRNIQ